MVPTLFIQLPLVSVCSSPQISKFTQEQRGDSLRIASVKPDRLTNEPDLPLVGQLFSGEVEALPLNEFCSPRTDAVCSSTRLI